jgi:membrane-bound inhibitor of C-type lysozyme
MQRLRFLCLALCGLAATPAAAADIVAHYTCQDGSNVVARFHNAGPNPSVTLRFRGTGREVTLPQGLSADGGRYELGKMTFWVKGRGATLTRSGGRTMCQASS